MSEPKTYWEKRCLASENLTFEFGQIVTSMMPPYVQEQINDLWAAYSDYILGLDEAEKAGGENAS